MWILSSGQIFSHHKFFWSEIFACSINQLKLTVVAKMVDVRHRILTLAPIHTPEIPLKAVSKKVLCETKAPLWNFFNPFIVDRCRNLIKQAVLRPQSAIFTSRMPEIKHLPSKKQCRQKKSEIFSPNENYFCCLAHCLTENSSNRSTNALTVDIPQLGQSS